MKLNNLAQTKVGVVPRAARPATILMRQYALASLLTFMMMVGQAQACGDDASLALVLNARNAVSPDPAFSGPAIAALRKAGPSGLAALVQTHQGLFDQYSANPAAARGEAADPAWPRLRAAMDAVGRQRDCFASRLFWFTDLEQARAAAQASGKPILSLRLLGNLDEELSCANSRFFRTTLYANAEVSDYLRAHFILHWKSVRPVPKLTIDFGDGRKLERTITGNSIHYILDPDGRIVDALPGLYGAKPFLLGLQQAEEAAMSSFRMAEDHRNAALRQFHEDRFTALEADFGRDLLRVGASPVPLARQNGAQLAPVSSSTTPANVAGRLTSSKALVEGPMLRGGRRGAALDLRNPDVQLDDATLEKIAALHPDAASLDEKSKGLLRAKGPNALDAARLALSKRRVEDPMLRTFQNLERSIAEDTVRNEYLIHSRIHQWLASGGITGNLEDFNARVYAELFLTPNSDPFLGLVTPATCSAIENDGRVQAAAR